LALTLSAIGIYGVIAYSVVAASRTLARFLYGVRPTYPVTVVAVVVILVGVAFLACYIPARRATRVDPMIASRYE
jgi:putative ABC transport system permease protein